MTCMHIKPEVATMKQLINDTTAVTAATKKACITWSHENYYLVGEGIRVLIGENVNLVEKKFWQFQYVAYV